MKYIVTGLNMLDVLEYPGEESTKPQLGGIPAYGYGGMRLFTDSIQYVARVGRDFYDIYEPWFTRNGIDRRGVRIISDKTPYNVIRYAEDGTIKSWDFFTGKWSDSDLWRPKAEDLERVLCDDIKGVYLTAGPEEEIWNGIFELRDRYGFKIMWEPNGIHTQPEDRKPIEKLANKLDMASFNLKESKRIFGLSNEEEVIEHLRGLGPEMVLLRLGALGLYTLTGRETIFVPSAPLPEGQEVVDVTGCGNSSTAAACYAWCEGQDAAMTGIMANVASSYNLRQKGPYPHFTKEVMSEALALANRLYREKQYTKR